MRGGRPRDDSPVQQFGYWRQWLLFWSIRLAGMFIVGGQLPYYHGEVGLFGDVKIYRGYAGLLQAGILPYRDFQIEYPPGILPLLYLPASSEPGFRGAFFTAAVAADAIILLLLLRAGRHRGAWLWVTTPLLLGPIVWARLDVFVALALVIATLAHERSRYRTGGVALAVAALLKLWPLLLLVPAVMLVTTTKHRVRILLSAMVTLFAVLAPLLAVGGGGGLLHVLWYHAHRGLEIESLAAVPLHLARLAGLRIGLNHAYGSVDFARPATNAILVVTTVASILSWTAALSYAIVRRGRTATLAQHLLLLTGLTLAASKVLSPQYVLWGVAACALALDLLPSPRALAASIAALMLSTQVLFPFSFSDAVNGSWRALPILLAHAGAVVLFAVTSSSSARASARAPSGLLARPTRDLRES